MARSGRSGARPDRHAPPDAPDLSVALELAGLALAHDGASLGEALDALATTVGLVCGREPHFSEARAVAVAWGEATLGYLHDLSCEDPLTGLATLAHVRSRVSEVYRAVPAGEPPAARSHALVVVAAPPAGEGRSVDGLDRALRVARLGRTARAVFPGPETIGQLGPARVVVLAGRDERIGRRVGLLRTMLADTVTPEARVWIEGLPETDHAAGALLDELARA